MNKQFEEWYIPFIRKHPDVGDRYFDHTLLEQFPKMLWSGKWGVYLEFGRSVGVWIEIVSETPESHFIKYLGEDIMSPFYEYKEADYYEGAIEEAQVYAVKQMLEIIKGGQS